MANRFSLSHSHTRTHARASQRCLPSVRSGSPLSWPSLVQRNMYMITTGRCVTSTFTCCNRSTSSSPSCRVTSPAKAPQRHTSAPSNPPPLPCRFPHRRVVPGPPRAKQHTECAQRALTGDNVLVVVIELGGKRAWVCVLCGLSSCVSKSACGVLEHGWTAATRCQCGFMHPPVFIRHVKQYRASFLLHHIR